MWCFSWCCDFFFCCVKNDQLTELICRSSILNWTSLILTFVAVVCIRRVRALIKRLHSALTPCLCLAVKDVKLLFPTRITAAAQRKEKRTQRSVKFTIKDGADGAAALSPIVSRTSDQNVVMRCFILMMPSCTDASVLRKIMRRTETLSIENPEGGGDGV